MKIRPEQVQVFSDAALDELAERAVALVAEHWPGELKTRGAGPTRARIRAAIGAARAHGFTTRQQALRFVNVVLALGDDFTARHEWAARALADRALTPDARLALVAGKTQALLDGELVE